MPQGPPSNRNDTGTRSISEICWMRLAPTRVVPFSYFCTCWNVSPNASPSFSWLMPSMMRRMRTRLPTYLSTGFGALVDILQHSRDYALIKARRSMPQTLAPSNPAGDRVGNADSSSNEGLGGFGNRMRMAASVCQPFDFGQEVRFATPR